MPGYVKDAGTHKEAAWYVRDAGTWKLLEGYVRDAGTWKDFVTAGPYFVAHTIASSGIIVKGNGFAQSTLSLNSSGSCSYSVSATGSNSPAFASNEWVNGGTPADWEVRCTVTSGSLSGGSGTGSWLRLNANREWTKTVSSGTPQTVSATIKLEFGAYLSSTPILTVTGIVLSCTLS